MFLENTFMAVIAVCFGFLVSGGVLTVFVSVGLIPRFAGKTHSGFRLLWYENMVCLGAIGGCIFSMYHKSFEIGTYVLKHAVMSESIWNYISHILLIIFGLFAGMFVGCFAIAIAEMLNTIPIFFRRVGFRHGLGIAILMIALGKITGSLFYFMKHIYSYGGL